MDREAYIKDLEMRVASLEAIEKGRVDAQARYDRDEKYRLSMLGHENNRWDFSDNMYLLPTEDWKNDIRLQQSGKNHWLWFDRWGMNPDFIKRFPNKIVNSGFEWFDENKKPLFWDTNGKVTDDSNWEGTVALELAPGQTAKQSTLAEIDRPHVPAGADPEWWENFPTRVSFKHKGARVKAWVERYDTGAPVYIYDNKEEGNINKFKQDVGFIREGYELEWGPIDNWAVFWDDDEFGNYVDRSADTMKYVTFGYASFWFMPEPGMGRVRVCFQNIGEEEGSAFIGPFWEEEKPASEWTIRSGTDRYYPVKTIQGHNEYSNSGIGNWVPTEDGQYLCAWAQDIGDDYSIMLGLSDSEENFFTNDYPVQETILIHNILGVPRPPVHPTWQQPSKAVAPVALHKLEDGKILLFIKDREPRKEWQTERDDWLTEPWGSNIKCYISPSGNGYEIIDEEKVSDFEYLSTVYQNRPGWSLPAHAGTFYGLDQETRWDRGMLNEPFRTFGGALILTACMGFNWREAGLIFRSTDQGETWTRVFGFRTVMYGDLHEGFCRPFQIKDSGTIFAMMQCGSGWKHMFVSQNDGVTWEEQLTENGNRFGHGGLGFLTQVPRFENFHSSFWYDEENDLLYMHSAGTYGGCGLYYLENPTTNRIMSFAYHRWKEHDLDDPESWKERSQWEFMMYTHSNALGYTRLYLTPEERLVVQFTDSVNWPRTSGRTVIIGFGGAGNLWLDAVQIEPDFTGKHPSFYTKGPRSISPVEIIGMPGIGVPGTDPDTGDPVLLPNPHADTHCVGGSDHVTPECIGAAPAEHEHPGMSVYRQTFFNATQWIVEHFKNNSVLISIWKGSVGDYGYGTQPYGTTPYGTGGAGYMLVEATHEPTIEELDHDRLQITWTEATSGKVVVIG